MVAPGSASAPLTSVACDEAEGDDIAGKGTVFSPAGDGAAGCVTTEGPAASVCTVSASADGVAVGCGTKAGASVCVAWEGAAGSAVAGVVGASVSAAPAVGSSTVAACGEVDTGCCGQWRCGACKWAVTGAGGRRGRHIVGKHHGQHARPCVAGKARNW